MAVMHEGHVPISFSEFTFLPRASLSAFVASSPDGFEIHPWPPHIGIRPPVRSRGRSTDPADTKPSTLATGTQLPSVGKFATRSSFPIEESSQSRDNARFCGQPNKIPVRLDHFKRTLGSLSGNRKLRAAPCRQPPGDAQPSTSWLASTGHHSRSIVRLSVL